MKRHKRNHRKSLISRFVILLIAVVLLCVAGHNIFVFSGQAQQVTLINKATSSYQTPTGAAIGGISNTLGLSTGAPALIDPAGKILNCAGQSFTDYTGFRVALFEPLGSLGEIGSLVALTPTFPSGSTPPTGQAPNTLNKNPFLLNGSTTGVYNFLLDPAKGQVAEGRTYILAISPPSESGLLERRIRIVVGKTQPDGRVAFTITSLDGKPVTIDGAAVFETGIITTSFGSALGSLGVAVSICEARELQIIKTGDRASAEPGDIPVYRLEVRNLTLTTISELVVTDNLPIGIQYVDGSARADIGGAPVPVNVVVDSRNITFNVTGSLPPRNQDRRLRIAFAARITPDALRGNGQNQASVSGRRADNGRVVRDGPSIYTLRINPGIISDCGTIIGRVFVDKNFDGEQQPNEPGVPNAVIFMDDGNRIITDANGLYSVMNVISGSRTLVLDLTSLPGYTLAPNLYFIERNSQSRLVRLEPSGLVKANFAVTPIFQGETQRGQQQ
ncbi:hypothetical protein V2H45_10675 [Tumidithrix elongata RA019]|uniref:DUF11 domain-containing protein n=1 Tax=Tumidithrix elongata BACA0141 TaxID=2716417 RepID=A0AAW9Q2S9_9CYAN|nr:hypothetical protein [Tumidithrix elongata RA019]